MILAVNSSAGASNIPLIVAVITFIGIVINVGISYINNKEGIKANVVSKARIEWIQEARAAASNFITECSNLILVVQSPIGGIYEPRTKEETKKMLSSINKTANLLILYFGTDNGENDVIVTKIEDITNSFTDENDQYFASKKFPEIEDKIKELRDILRVYFKKEWKRVSKL
jgi:hypothetical protein